MAKKTRKQKQRATTRRPPVAAQPGVASAPAPSAPVEAVPADGGAALAAVDAAASVAIDIPASESGRRRVERVAGAAAPVRPRSTRGQTQGYIASLDSEDAAIPFDRVPYVPSDLRRVAIIAAIMIALIVVADIIVSNVVK